MKGVGRRIKRTERAFIFSKMEIYMMGNGLKIRSRETVCFSFKTVSSIAGVFKTTK